MGAPAAQPLHVPGGRVPQGLRRAALTPSLPLAHGVHHRAGPWNVQTSPPALPTRRHSPRRPRHPRLVRRPLRAQRPGRGNHDPAPASGVSGRGLAVAEVLRGGPVPPGSAPPDWPARAGALGRGEDADGQHRPLRLRGRIRAQADHLGRAAERAAVRGVRAAARSRACLSLSDGVYEIRAVPGGSEVALTTRYRGHLRPRALFRPLERRLTHEIHGHILAGMRTALEAAAAQPAPARVG